MKRYFFLVVLLLTCGSLSPMVRAAVNVGPDPYYDSAYNSGMYYDGYWYGPGWYYGNYYDDYPTYYAWRTRYYTGRPYYWHRRHK